VANISKKSKKFPAGGTDCEYGTGTQDPLTADDLGLDTLV